MPFGWAAPLPLRLGSDSELSVSAEQHARFCADLLAVHRTVPAATLLARVDYAASPPCQAWEYIGRNGMGVGEAPALSNGASDLFISLSAATNAYARVVDLMPYVVAGYAATAANDDGRVLYAYHVAGGTIAYSVFTWWQETVWIDIYGTDNATTIGDYGGALDKRNSQTEGNTTYCWQWYQYLVRADGSAYATRDTSVRSWELRAQARALGTSQRISEMLAASASPGCSDLRLGRWCTVLGVQQANRTKAQLRAACEAKYIPPEAQTTAVLIAALQGAIGDKGTIVSISHPSGTMTTWPDATYWPGIIDGDSLYDISGDGMWSSSRCRLTVRVTPSPLVSAREMLEILNRDAAAELDLRLPASDEFAWDISSGVGFILDTSALDFTAL